MSDNQPPDPFPWWQFRKQEPSPSVGDILKNLPPPPPAASAAEALIRMASQPQSISAPPKSITDRLKDHVALGFRLLRENKLTKSSSTSWIARLKVLIQPIFGGGTPYMKGLEDLRKRCGSSGITEEEFHVVLERVADFADFLEGTAGVASGSPVSRAARIPASRNVFIIHGKDELNARRLADYLREDESVIPIVMMARPGMSRPLTDKFEDEASKCVLAFALFTADDLVSANGDEYQQARPNVIYETGWFIGRLGKTRVVLLLQSGAEMHTDLQGVSRIHFEHDVREKFQDIHRELKAALLC
jgi:predicted nucleotide-binding protein